jgi:hypothetical protein
MWRSLVVKSRLCWGGDGVIYAINDTGDLLWFRHDGRADKSGGKIGVGWGMPHVFAG